jgi:hypothetical protein
LSGPAGAVKGSLRRASPALDRARGTLPPTRFSKEAFFTDGFAWHQRRSDLRKIIRYQNIGDIARIYTYSTAQQFDADLRQLKDEYAL